MPPAAVSAMAFTLLLAQKRMAARTILAAGRRHALLPSVATRTLRHALSMGSAGPAAAAPLLPPPTPDGRLTVCLDMDECLLHAEVADAAIKGCADLSRQAQARADERKDLTADFEFELPYLDAPVRVFKRPGLDDFLLEAGRVRPILLTRAFPLAAVLPGRHTTAARSACKRNECGLSRVADSRARALYLGSRGLCVGDRQADRPDGRDLRPCPHAAALPQVTDGQASTLRLSASLHPLPPLPPLHSLHPSAPSTPTDHLHP